MCKPYLVLTALVAFGFGARVLNAQQDLSEITLDDIAAAWRARHDEVRSGVFEWTETRWISERHWRRMRAMGGTAEGRSNPTDAESPFEDQTLVFGHKLTFEGTVLRHERWSLDPHTVDALPDSHVAVVWDGVTGRVLREGEEYPRGRVHHDGFGLGLTDLVPFRVAFRMLDPNWLDMNLAEYVLSEQRDVVGGDTCLLVETAPHVLRQMASDGLYPWKKVRWVNPEQNFAVVRLERRLEGRTRPAQLISIQYDQDSESGWFPARWTIVNGSGDPPNEIIEAEVASWSMNIPIDEETFSLDFPEGTWTHEFSPPSPSTYENYIVREEENRPVTQEELLRGATYEDLLASSSGQAGLRPAGAQTNRWILWTGATVLALLVTGWFLRQRLG